MPRKSHPANQAPSSEAAPRSRRQASGTAGPDRQDHSAANTGSTPPDENCTESAAGTSFPPGSEPAAVQDGFALLGDVIARAQRGDPAALQELRNLLDANPDVWQAAGDLAGMLQAELIRQVAGGSPFVIETLSRNVAEMRSELAGPAPAPLIAMAVDRLLVCWLHLHRLELTAPPPSHERTPRDAWWRKQVDDADRRYQAAVRMLTTLQRRKVTGLGPTALRGGLPATSKPAEAAGKRPNAVVP